MARTVWMFFWIVLVVWGVTLVDVRGVGDAERAVLPGRGVEAKGATASSVGGDDGGVGVEGGVGGVPPSRTMEEGELSQTDGAPGDVSVVEEGQGSGGGDTEDTFRDLPELSSGGRIPRLHQSTLLQAFASSSQMGQPDLEGNE